jgi:hypothetical protein
MLDQARFTHTPLTEQNDSSLMGGRLEYARLELGARTEGFTLPHNGKPSRYRPDDRLLAFLKDL